MDSSRQVYRLQRGLWRPNWVPSLLEMKAQLVGDPRGTSTVSPRAHGSCEGRSLLSGIHIGFPLYTLSLGRSWVPCVKLSQVPGTPRKAFRDRGTIKKSSVFYDLLGHKGQKMPEKCQKSTGRSDVVALIPKPRIWDVEAGGLGVQG